MLVGNLRDEGGVGAHACDLRSVADDPCIARQLLPILVRLRQQAFRHKAQKGLLEPRPFGFDNGPGKPGQKIRLVISASTRSSGMRASSAWLMSVRQQRGKLIVAAFALRRPAPGWS